MRWLPWQEKGPGGGGEIAECSGDLLRTEDGGDRRGGGGGALAVVDSGAVVAVGSGRVGVGGGKDMIATELADTKVVGTRVLPGLGRRV